MSLGMLSVHHKTSEAVICPLPGFAHHTLAPHTVTLHRNQPDAFHSTKTLTVSCPRNHPKPEADPVVVVIREAQAPGTPLDHTKRKQTHF